MNVVILAAGVGKRLAGAYADGPKSLLRFNGQSLIARHLAMLDTAGVDRVFIVVGYLAEQIEAEVARCQPCVPVTIIRNDNYTAGSAISLLKAEAAYRDTAAIVMDADLLFDPAMFTRLLEQPAENALLVDRRLQDSGEEVKVVARGGRVWELSKVVSGEGEIIGESVGVFRFSAAAGHELAQALSIAVDTYGPNVEYERVIDDVLKRVSVQYVAIDDLAWIEIDFPHDVERAEREIAPRLAAGDRR